MALVALPNIIRYFRDCYEEDNRRSTLWNIFHASVTHRLFVEREEELLNGFLTEIPLDPDDGLEARKAAYLYQKEKELVYCSLFVVGRIRAGDEEPRAICAPLLIHPAEIIEQPPHTFLKPDFDARRLNYHLLDALEGDSSQNRLSREAAELLNHGPIAAEQVFELSALLEEFECLLDQRLHKTIKLVKVLNQSRLRESLGKHRQQFSTFLRAIRACTGVKQEDLFQRQDILNIG